MRGRLLRNHNCSRLPIGSVAKFILGAAILDSTPSLAELEIPGYAGGELHRLLGIELDPPLRDHAVWGGPDGRIERVTEDVGRHNALDKLIGRYFAEDALPLLGRGLLFSGRASFELVQKAAVAGCPFVAAIGPPSSLAVELALEQRMTLVGFLREGRFNIYTLPHRIARGG